MRLILVMLLGTCCGGCASSGLLDFTKDEPPAPPPRSRVVESLCIWQPAEGVGLQGEPTRGFAGQILFFSRDLSAPIPADGDVRIYVFDDQGTEEEQTRPIHQFDFPSEVWQTYLHESTLGPGYSLFIPYTRKGPHQARCSLRLRLTPKNGPVVYSDMVSIILQGKSPSEDKEPELSREERERLAREKLAHQKLAELTPSGSPRLARDLKQPSATADTIRQAAAVQSTKSDSRAVHSSAEPLGNPALPDSGYDDRLGRVERILNQLLQNQLAQQDATHGINQPAPDRVERHPGAQQDIRNVSYETDAHPFEEQPAGRRHRLTSAVHHTPAGDAAPAERGQWEDARESHPFESPDDGFSGSWQDHADASQEISPHPLAEFDQAPSVK